MIKCKGCAGTVAYTPLEAVKQTAGANYYHAGPALTHNPPQTPCPWFLNTPAQQVIAYINMADYKAKAEQESVWLQRTK